MMHREHGACDAGNSSRTGRTLYRPAEPRRAEAGQRVADGPECDIKRNVQSFGGRSNGVFSLSRICFEHSTQFANITAHSP